MPAVHTKKMVISEEKMFFASHTEEEVSVTGIRQFELGITWKGFCGIFISLVACNSVMMWSFLSACNSVHLYHFTCVCFNFHFCVDWKLSCTVLQQ